MAKRLQYRRVLLLAVLLGAAFAGLGYRLVDLQVFRHDELRELAEENTRVRMMQEPRRGDILDARGNPLATSVFVKTVCADPTLLGNRQAEVARLIAPLLQVDERALYQRLLPTLRTNASGRLVTNQYVRLRQKVPSEMWQRIQATMREYPPGLDEKKLTGTDKTFYRNLRNKAIFTEAQDDQLRVYPNHALASHVLGFTAVEDREVNGKAVRETMGREGLEKTLNEKLSGARGWRVTETDSRKREQVSLRDQDVEARDGLNAVLTIDSVIQNIVETALAEAREKHAPLSISGVVVRPRTGEILALASLPDFDPNDPGKASPDARRNRVITDIVEPGSTFKIVVVSGALNDGVVRLEDVFDCEHGQFAFAGRILHDHESYGDLSVEKIITKSSNIGAAKVGIKLGQNRLYDYMRSYGFGSRSAILLPGEVPGMVPPVKNWYKVSLAQIPMGHGIAGTRLQMLMSMSAIANKGWLMQPMLVSRLEDQQGRAVARYEPQRIRQVIGEPAARLMVTALKTVVSPEGTAPKAALEHYTVAGKTGTAQKAGPGGYMPGKYISSFIGFFPADNPAVCISVVLDEPRQGYYGGQTAAPVFKQIAERVASYLNIVPDKLGEQPSVNENLAATPSPAIKTVSARSLNNPEKE